MSIEDEHQENYDHLAGCPNLTEDRGHRNHWLNRASDLHASAGAIWYSMEEERSKDITTELGLDDHFSMSTACFPVYHMLCGLALELIMKAVLVSKGVAPPEKHNLNDLAGLIGIRRNVNEKRILRFYQESVVWAGRYPVPRNANDQKLLQYWDMANKVLTKPKDMGQKTTLKFYVGSGATDWREFDELYKSYAQEFDCESQS